MSIDIRVCERGHLYVASMLEDACAVCYIAAVYDLAPCRTPCYFGKYTYIQWKCGNCGERFIAPAVSLKKCMAAHTDTSLHTNTLLHHSIGVGYRYIRARMMIFLEHYWGAPSHVNYYLGNAPVIYFNPQYNVCVLFDTLTSNAEQYQQYAKYVIVVRCRTTLNATIDAFIQVSGGMPTVHVARQKAVIGAIRNFTAADYTKSPYMWPTPQTSASICGDDCEFR